MALRHILLAAVLWYGPTATPLWSWDLDVHRLVNGHAVDLTPGPLGDFLRLHRERIVALSIDADHRREHDPSEAPNHYIEFEYYGGLPYFSVPYDRGEAEARFGAENMAKWGVLPWHTLDVTQALRDALANGEWDKVVVLAADLGHYVADGHQPFHTTANYDGQLSGNTGIHRMFELFMVNRYLDHYHRPTPPLPLVEDLPASLFMWLVENLQEVEGILAADTWAREDLTSQAKAIISQGYDGKPDVIPSSYLERLYVQTGLTAWTCMTKATVRLAALWLWAWEEAGRPTPPQSVWPWAYPPREVPESPDR